MSLENNISKVIQEQLQGDLIERVIEKQLENCVQNAVNELFGHWGEAKKIVEKKIQEVMIPQLSQYDYSQHITKLDDVLTEILKATTLDNKKILENFKEFMLPDAPKEIELTELFRQYANFVAEEVDTTGLEVDYDDEPSYEAVEIRFEVEDCPGRGWSIYEEKKVFFECVHEVGNKDELHFEINIDKWKDAKEDKWSLRFNANNDINSLRHLDKFTMYLLKLSQAGTKIIIDRYGDEEWVTPEQEPEASWS